MNTPAKPLLEAQHCHDRKSPEDKQRFIICFQPRDDPYPRYATTSGLAYFDPFQGRPFCERLLCFHSEGEARAFIRRHFSFELADCFSVELFAPQIQRYLQTLDDGRSDNRQVQLPSLESISN